MVTVAHTHTEVPSSLFLTAWRPWLSLYGQRLKQGGTAPPNDEDLSLVQRLLSEELLVKVFEKLPITSLGIVPCVCKQWRSASNAPSLWKNACREVFWDCDLDRNTAICREKYHSSWKRMFLHRSHLRHDGIYVSRNTYLRAGITEWRVKNPVHLVTYYRYFRFLPHGSFYYRTSPETLSKIANSLRYPKDASSSSSFVEKKKKYTQLNVAITTGQSSSSSSSSSSAAHEVVHKGRYKLTPKDTLFTALQYNNSASTEIRTRMKLRSTVVGANNRLDVESIVSWDRSDGSETALPLDAGAGRGGDNDNEDEGVETRNHNRGMSTFVFVPWEEVHASILNNPPSVMDFYVPG